MSIEAASSDPHSRADGRAPSPAELAREVTQAFLEERWDRLEELIHPEAELETGFAVPGTRFRRRQVLDAGWAARSTGAYQPEYELVESLDERTALVAVKLRFQIGADLFSERDAAFLMTFEDGQLWETLVFESSDAALAAHRARSRATS